MSKFLQGGAHKLIKNFKFIILICICVAFILFFVACVCDALIQAQTYIDITDYPVNIDYGILSDKQIETFNNILDAVDKGESYVSCPTYSRKERHEIATHIEMHFGYWGTIDNIGHLIIWDSDGAYLNLNMFNKLSNDKIIIDARVDEAVSTLREGSDKYKLWQISNYIAKKLVYTQGIRQETITALNGKGMCLSYSMLFYKMATRLGIKTYICCGWVTPSLSHAWNMVELNGEYRYYDITLYDDILHNIIYIHSKFSCITNFLINNKWTFDLDMPNTLFEQSEIYNEYIFIDNYLEGEYDHLAYIYEDADDSIYVISNCGCCIRKVNFEKTAIIEKNE